MEGIIETIKAFFTNGEFWGIVLKVLTTALLTAGVGLLGTFVGKAIVKSKNSKIYKYIDICVKAAEQKFPNEGKKMGTEKMQYVMDQIAIKFPKVKENTTIYNMVEAAVYELNKEKQQQEAVKDFKEKYGETPLFAEDVESKDEVASTQENTEIENVEKVSLFQALKKQFVSDVVEAIKEEKDNVAETAVEEVTKPVTTQQQAKTKSPKIRSF